MEKVKILGMRWVDMDVDNGRKVLGWTLYISFPADNVQGVQTGKCFVSDVRWNNLTYQPAVGDDVLLVYNRTGKVADILTAPAK